ncbi:ribonuclease E inhibitor RraB [Streptomyces sp. Wb2n-11]|uniref:ribonuclease E inhibitor RraB n=1 Tax=Streptomyces sp. Wb2n-11 TaxID=1030533 RepID=UPI001147A52C|nr:ribonuclease E inhibitor RraB [Streptomyces sp. Wb2n-11]
MERALKIPYTHWAYFPDRSSAEQCAQGLADYVTRVREPIGGVPRWLLLAARDVEISGLVERHLEVEEIVIRHGGDYDGGEAIYDLQSGQAVVDPMIVKLDGDDQRGAR